MSRPLHPSVFLALSALALSWLVAGCAGENGPSGPSDIPPTITVLGIEDGETTQGPVTIQIEVDRGTWRATLDGEPFLSGQTVTEPGSHVLGVQARNGTATSNLEIRFEITLSGETRLIVRVFDLGANDAGGGGDAILLTDSSSAGMEHALVDAGPAGPGASDPGFVARRLASLEVDTLQLLLLSHAHSDHFDGIPDVLDAARVELFVWNGQERNFSRYDATISQARSEAGAELVPSQPTTSILGFGQEASEITVIPPLTTFLADPDAGGTEINEGSIGVELRKGGFRMFLTGDGEIEANRRWRLSFGDRSAAVDVLKVGHHGGNDAVFDNGFSGSSAWLGHTAPAVNVVSANGTTHPRQNATAFLLSISMTRTYCTNVHGDIEIRVGEAGDFDVTVERNAGADCEAGSQADT